MNSYYFLLGGYDLEMVEIRKLLEANAMPFADLHLTWGAKWSDYTAVIEQYHRQTDWQNRPLVGIELSGPRPDFAMLIDHHNELSHRPASIVQVAELLGVSLNRFQRLVAANDTGYIPAMRDMGATDEEIQEIRRLDRQAQGVTSEMEQQAEKDIRLINIENGVTVVYTDLTKFSPIADRLSVPRLLIYSSSQLTYYGEGAAKLGTLFAEDVAAGRMYFGGGENGYFGIGTGHYSPEAIQQFVYQICTYF